MTMFTSPSIWPRRIRIAGWIMLLSLAFGQLGFGPGLIALGEPAMGDCCPTTCPCADEVAAAGSMVLMDTGLDSDDGPAESESLAVRGHSCLPDCDDCACCQGVLIAVAVPAPTHPKPTGRSADASPPHDFVPLGVWGRIFRPPQSLRV